MARDRSLRQEPIVPAKDGAPPGWVVRCRDCEWAHDAHGADADQALASLSGVHEAKHRLAVEAVNYRTGYPERPGGDGMKNFPHPLYR